MTKVIITVGSIAAVITLWGVLGFVSQGAPAKVAHHVASPKPKPKKPKYPAHVWFENKDKGVLTVQPGYRALGAYICSNAEVSTIEALPHGQGEVINCKAGIE